ncbi:DUF1552 domain-containing protein [Pseudobacteriovorax antillogorgiicola]|uniref:DUF1552 domain-containing protein n=1 Tax=Pseudobacteriovorax antillogorgiicola TaxID=1513793 RepID=A0A1Y6BHJ5_9BACT|nr:DUF1552 domain-containing protein [Pseudobacteriovorax antillogorgiicola]TCS57380.1 uncharacterized protein DUF1552 [Pseudobacteriovorax antillogorgiicola]SMF01826.1 Protein of unknown function [Pseudobacteriovorax antillogorgiicola]
MTRKVTRRQFAQYLRNGAIAAAFSKTIISEQALGAVPGKNLVIFSHPNGHKSWGLTQAAVNGTGMASRALLSEGMFYNTNGISHGGAANILRFNANQGGSFDIDLDQAMGIKTLRLAIDFNPNQNQDNMCRDANGQLGRIVDNPQKAFDDLFSDAAVITDPGMRQDIYAGKKSIIDHCLEDVRKIKSGLGSLGSLFDENLQALIELQEQILTLQSEAAEAATQEPPATQCANPQIQIPNGPSPQNYNAYFDVMSEIIYQGIVCNRTQVAVLQMSNAQSDMVFNFPGSPVNSNAGFHGGLVHGTNRGNDYQQIVSWYIGKVAGFANRLAMTTGDVLKDSAVVHLSEMGIADHSTRDIPFIVYGELGGAIQTGRRIQGNSSTSSFLKTVTDDMFGPVVGQGVTPMRGLA